VQCIEHCCKLSYKSQLPPIVNIVCRHDVSRQVASSYTCAFSCILALQLIAAVLHRTTPPFVFKPPQASPSSGRLNCQAV
jgi:hypothetical protein